MRTRIERLDGWEALDSRGNPTVACRVTTADGRSGTAMAPSGASTGGHEAVELRDGDARYGGRGVRAAVANVVEIIAPALRGRDCAHQDEIDAVLEELDGGPDFAAIGANAALASSVACAVAAAASMGIELHEHLSPDDDGAVELPLPMVNVFSGGAHAARAVDLQDYLVVPLTARSFAAAIEIAAAVRRAAVDVASGSGSASASLVADEGGIAAPGPRNEAALALLTEAIERAGLEPGVDAAIAIDVAANQFATVRQDGYSYDLLSDGVIVDTAEWADIVCSWVDRWPIASIEDPVAEDDWDGWRDLTRRIGDRVQLLGDDFFVTDVDRLRRGIDRGCANAVLIKPNQTGTLTRACRAVQCARTSGYRTVLSARSGETEESWLADLAVAWRTGQIKVGSTTRSERTAKWNRLLAVEHLAGPRARYRGAAAIGGRRS